MENSGLFEYTVHPCARQKTFLNRRKDGTTKEFIYCGIAFKNDKTTIIVNKNKEMFQVSDIIVRNNKIFFKGKKLLNTQFVHELTAYSFDSIQETIEEISFESIWKNFGHV